MLFRAACEDVLIVNIICKYSLTHILQVMPSHSYHYPERLKSSGSNFLSAGGYVLYKLASITSAHNRVQIEKFRVAKEINNKQIN